MRIELSLKVTTTGQQLTLRTPYSNPCPTCSIELVDNLDGPVSSI